MFDDLNLEERGIYIIIGFIAMSIIYWVFSDAISAWSTSANGLAIIFAYFLSNPVYLFLIISMSAWKQLKGFLSSLIIVLAFDIASLPHYIKLAGALPSDASSFFSVEMAIFKTSHIFASYIGTFIIYVLIPILLMILALEIVGIKTFSKLVERHGG